MKKILIFLLILLLALTACNPQPAPPTDLSSLQQRLDHVGSRLDVVSADLRQLQAVAVTLDAAVRASANLEQFLGGLTGIVVESWPPDVEVWIESGPCPEGIETGRYAISTSSVGTSYHSLPAGTYCVATAETDELQHAGVTLTVPDGVIVSTTLYAREKEATP